MRKLLALWVLLIGIGLATPALAGHRGHSRGQRIVRGGYHSRAAYYPRYARYQAGPAFRVGFYAPAPVYYFGPGPAYLDPWCCEPVWVPGHYVRSRGARVWIGGYWVR